MGGALPRWCFPLKIANIFLCWPFWYIIRGTYFILPQPTHFQPPLFQIFVRFFIQNHICPIAPRTILVMQNFLAHLLMYVKKLPHLASMPERPRKSWIFIFDLGFPGNWFKIDIISNDFWCSTIWEIQIQVLFTAFKNPQNPGIQPTHIEDILRFVRL